MKFEYSEKLRQYMQKKGRHDVLVYLVPPMG